MSNRIVVVANRLPVRRVEGVWQTSPGGLVSAVKPTLRERDGVWIGWSGIPGHTFEPFDHEGVGLVPVTLSAEEVAAYYLGFANRTIWPLYHDAIRTPEYEASWWEGYNVINERFAAAAASLADEHGLIWVHDYQLQLVPRLLRENGARAEIRFFLHIPFPPVELFARLPWRDEIIDSLTHADVVGFQTTRSATNFITAATGLGSSDLSEDTLITEGRSTKVVVAPISIDVADFIDIANDPLTDRRVEAIRAELGGPEIIFLGADRLDYTKGIDLRLRAFEALLAAQPDLAERTKFVQIGVPSRETIGDYAEMRARIERIAGRINSVHGSRHRMPVHYSYESLSREELVAYYRAADVMTVTPLVDGMNLVAKEYVASRIDNGGVLVLSEFAGAARELSDAVLVNPYDIGGMARRMLDAVQMSPRERVRRMRAMRQVVLTHDVHDWARLALDSDTAMAGV